MLKNNDRIECDKLVDPVYQLGVGLYPFELINEKFLLSWRNCQITVSSEHQLQKKMSNRLVDFNNNKIQLVYELLNKQLRESWTIEASLSPSQKKDVLRVLYLLSDEVYFLDLLLLKAAFYIKIGNTSRASSLLLDFIHQSPYVLVEKGIFRRDPLAIMLHQTMDSLLKTVVEGLHHQFELELLIQYMTHFYQDSKLNKSLNKWKQFSTNEILDKLKLKYHKNQSGILGNFLLNQYLIDKPYTKFLHDTLDKIPAEELWIFLWRIPPTGVLREKLLERVLALKESDPYIYDQFLQNNDLAMLLKKKNSFSQGEILHFRRSLFHQRLKNNPGDALSFYELLKIGDAGDWLQTQIWP